MNLKGQLENAVRLLLTHSNELPEKFKETANAKAKIYMGADSDTISRPCVVVWCQGGQEEPQGSGNFRMQMTVLVKSLDTPDMGAESGCDPVAIHNDDAAAVFGILQYDNLGEQLSDQVEDLKVYDPVTDTSLDPSLDGHAFVDGFSFSAYCCGSHIPD